MRPLDQARRSAHHRPPSGDRPRPRHRNRSALASG